MVNAGLVYAGVEDRWSEPVTVDVVRAATSPCRALGLPALEPWEVVMVIEKETNRCE